MADKQPLSYENTGKKHPYHLVEPSPWPLLGALAAGLLAVGAVMYMHDVEFGGVKVGLKGLLIGLLSVLAVMFFWWKDVIYEAVVEKAHSSIAQIGMRYGMALFIASEVMFFVAFFWAFFDASIFPADAIGGVWPPEGMKTVDPFDLPFLMTMILLLSGCTVTWAHHAILEDNQKEFRQALGLTVLLGVIFLGFQTYEYGHLIHDYNYSFDQNVFTATFFMATGFHGFHVLIGTIFLFVCWLRAHKNHFNADQHFGFEAAAWYWHFVDVVWLFLFVAVYWWGGA